MEGQSRQGLPRLGCEADELDFRIKIEERFQARAQLLFNLFFAAFEHVHRHVCFAAVAEFYRSLTHFHHVFGGQ